MKLNTTEAVNVLESTIEKDLKHPYYERTVELADLYRKYITGADLDSELIQFNPRENDEEFKQRKRLSSLTTPALASSIMNPFYKVPRTDRVVKKIIPLSKGNTQLRDEIQKKLDLFYGSDNEEGGLDYWLKNRFVELSFIDPNTFIVIEFDNFDYKKEYPTAYPFEVSAEMAVNFDIENNNVDWLIVKEPIKFVSELPDKFTDGFQWKIFCGEFAYKYREVSGNKSIQLKVVFEGETVVKVGEKYYAVSVVNTKLADWQMFRIGYVRDLETDGETFVNPFHAAMCHFKSSIKDVSEFNLSKSIHTFPQKMQYVTTCNGAKDDTCNKGRNIEGLECTACHGTGVNVHKSSQDVITIPLPEDKEDMFPLSEMMAYFSPPIELLDFMDKQVDKYSIKIHQTVFNSTVLVQKTIVATATEKDQDMDSVYDTLFKFASKSAAVYLNVANAIAVLMGKTDQVTFVFRYPSDFKMKSRQILYNEIKTINDSGAPSFVKESVEDDLAEQIYVDDPEGLLRYKVKSNLTPFKGKTEEQIAALLSSPLVLDGTKILFNYFEEIMKQAELDNKGFYVKKYSDQKTIVEAIVETYKVKLTPVQPIIPVVDVPTS